MTIQAEFWIKKHFEHEAILTVDVVDNCGNARQETFYNYYEAIRDITNLESEFDVYF